MSHENENLIQQLDNINKKDNSIHIKYALILPATIFLFVGGGINTYVVNEWTQYIIRTDNFPNISSVHNFSACTETNHSEVSYKQYTTVQQKSAMWLAVYNTTHHIPMLFASMILASYTDTRGRRFLFVLTSLTMSIRYSLTAVIIYFKLSFLFIAATYALDGLTGSSFAMLGAIFSYIADITNNDKQRVTGIAIIEVTLVMNTTLSSLLSGCLIDTWSLGYLYTSIIAAFLSFIGFFIFAFLVPETLSKNQQQESKPLLATLRRPAEFYFSAEFRGKRLCYILLILCFTFAELSDLNRSSLETLYFLGQPFCWGPSQIGVFSMVRHASKGVIGLCVLRLFQKLMSNQAISIISTLSNAASYIVEAFATTDLMIYMVPVAGMFSFLMVPIIRALMSGMTADDKQGALFASMSFIQVLCSVLSSYVENGIYAATLSFMNGFVFLVLATFSMIEFTLLTAYCCVKPYYSIVPRVTKYHSVHINTKV